MSHAARLGLVVAACAGVGCAALIGASFGDATLAADASEDAVTFSDLGTVVSPTAISGLALWLDATRGVDVSGQSVTRWRDQSSNARDAIAVGNSSQAPTVATAINAPPMIHFVAAASQLLATSWAGPGGNALTLFVVSKGYAQSAIRFQTAASQPPAVIFPFDINAANDAAASFGLLITGEPFARVELRTDQLQLLTARFASGGMTSTYDDGQLAEQHLPVLTTLPDGQTLYIGGALPLLAAPYTASQFFDGDLAEILVYTAGLSDADRMGIEGYLRSKWGI